MKRTLADFTTLNSEPLELVKLGHRSHLSEPLQPGEPVELLELFDDELLVLARVQDDAAADSWLAAPVWASRRAQVVVHVGVGVKHWRLRLRGGVCIGPTSERP
jgi:hypothetical protein